MCGRFVLADDDSGDLAEINKIVEMLNVKYYGGNTPKFKMGEIFPTDDVPVILPCAVSRGGVTVEVMKWGFPKRAGSGVIINARSESVKENKAFCAEAALHRRCVIPSTGYFEWKAEAERKKTKYLFRWPDTKALYMAGIYTDGRFVIMTTEANQHVSPIHDRMPVVLRKNEIKTWLNKDFYLELAFNRDNVLLENYAQ